MSNAEVSIFNCLVARVEQKHYPPKEKYEIDFYATTISVEDEQGVAITIRLYGNKPVELKNT